MTAGIYLNRHRGILEKTFRVDKTYYMPPESLEGKKCQPYAESMSWSRRFIGLKVFLSLAVAGWEGYREVLRHQVKLGNLLRSKLQEKGWEVLNETPLPVLCFRDKRNSNSHSAQAIEAFAKKIGDSGKAWITTTRLGASGTPALRAGITNFVTAESDIVQLVDLLDQLR